MAATMVLSIFFIELSEWRHETGPLYRCHKV